MQRCVCCKCCETRGCLKSSTRRHCVSMHPVFLLLNVLNVFKMAPLTHEQVHAIAKSLAKVPVKHCLDAFIPLAEYFGVEPHEVEAQFANVVAHIHIPPTRSVHNTATIHTHRLTCASQARLCTSSMDFMW